MSSVACALALQVATARAQSPFDFLFGVPQSVQPAPRAYAYPPVQHAPWGGYLGVRRQRRQHADEGDRGLRRFRRPSFRVEQAESNGPRLRRRPRPVQQATGEGPERPATRFSGRGGYRTLCVRSCDGYYWPISFSTSQSRFKQDEKLCKASCPNQKVALYVHRTEGQNSDEAISVKDDEPISELKNAFLYRREYKPECKCDMSQPLVASRGGPEKRAQATPVAAAVGSALKAVPQTAARAEPISGADVTGSVPSGSEKGGPGEKSDVGAATPEAPREADPNRRVRVVGPNLMP